MLKGVCTSRKASFGPVIGLFGAPAKWYTIEHTYIL